MPELTAAGFKQRFTLMPLCKPTPSSSIGSLMVFCEFEWIYMDIHKDQNTWKTTYVTKKYSSILLISSKNFP